MFCFLYVADASDRVAVGAVYEQPVSSGKNRDIGKFGRKGFLPAP
jgi:hypothetical protein